ncbi:unnamed protein product [marine sediment metagenome]|uniref:Uncharacterized protein n=1 Tax=marine sediment metagenome TaxID=412755 RepID=X1BAB5_9ZZZZ
MGIEIPEILEVHGILEGLEVPVENVLVLKGIQLLDILYKQLIITA